MILLFLSCGMPSTQNSPEYQILGYLNENKNRLKDKVSEEDIFNGIKLEDRHRFDNDLPTLSPHYITPPNGTTGFKITKDGQARFGDLQKHIDNLSTKNSIDRLAYIGAIIGIIGLIFTCIETCNSSEDLELHRQELKLQQEQQTIHEDLDTATIVEMPDTVSYTKLIDSLQTRIDTLEARAKRK